MQYLILILLWLAYFTIHSLLVTQKVKKYFEVSMGHAFRYYRLLYNCIAIMGLLGILFYNAVIPSPMLLPPNWLPIVKFIGLTLAIWGVLVLRLAFKVYSLQEFLGITQARNETTTDQKLQTGGILQYVRHPIYTGTLLLIWGFWLFSPTLAHLISMVCISVYVWIGMRLEEAKLLTTFGDAYRQYKKNVPALIPSWQALKKVLKK